MLGSEVDPSTRIDPLKFPQPNWTSGIQLPFSRQGWTIQVIILQPNWGQLRSSDESHVFKCAAPIIAVLGMQLSTVPQHGEPPPLDLPCTQNTPGSSESLLPEQFYGLKKHCTVDLSTPRRNIRNLEHHRQHRRHRRHTPTSKSSTIGYLIDLLAACYISRSLADFRQQVWYS